MGHRVASRLEAVVCRSRDGQLTGHRVRRQCQVLSQTHMQDHLWGQPDRHTADSQVGWPASHGSCRPAGSWSEQRRSAGDSRSLMVGTAQ